MSDRSDDSGIERVADSVTETVPRTQPVPADPAITEETPRSDPGAEATEWAVPAGVQPQTVLSPSTVPPATPSWPGGDHYDQPNPWTANPSGMFGPSEPRAEGPGPGAPGGRADGRRGRGWFLVAVVAALIGASVGAGVTALTENNNPQASVNTIREGDASPGAAIDNGASIPNLVDRLLPAVVSIDVKTPQEEDQGSGMIVSSDGMVVTNFHVVALVAEAGGTLTVTENGSTSPRPATLVGTDPTDDVALLRITGASNLKTVTFGNSDKAVVGDAVVAIGDALGLSQSSPTVTQGIVSAIGRTVTAQEATGTESFAGLLQTDAAINPGNSGGPLVDTEGEVIGMNSFYAGTTSDGTNAQNIGFAIPSARIEALLPNLQKGTPTAAPGYMGVDIATLTPALRTQYGFTPQSGAVVLSVVAGGPADLAGLAQEDIIVAVNSKPIASAAGLQAATQGATAGQRVTVTYYRGAVEKTTSLTLISESALQAVENQGAGGLGGSGG